jgi:hypothetical protein
VTSFLKNIFCKNNVIYDIFNRGKNRKKERVMKQGFLRLLIAGICLNVCLSLFSQENGKMAGSGKTITDSLINNGIKLNDSHKQQEIILSTDQAIRFLQDRCQSSNWIDAKDPFRMALNQLIYEASHPRFDSAEYLLKRYPYDSLSIPWDKFYIWEPLRFKIPNIPASVFNLRSDSIARADSNLIRVAGDSARLKTDVIGNLSGERKGDGLKDTTIMVVVDTLHEVQSSVSGFPFRYFNFPYQGDSIKVAVKSLLEYLDRRDSSVINFTGIGNSVTPVWMNTRTEKVYRYWLKNELSDSVTVWIGNPSRNTIDIYLEQGVSFRRPVRQDNYSKAKVNVHKIDNSKLLESRQILVKPLNWRYHSESAFILSQTALSNWVKGGENSISTAMDVTYYADYNNKPLKLSSNNFVRLKLGFLKSGSDKIKKNIDLLETNSKFNHKAFGKFDFSAIMLIKTQIANGYTYSRDSNNMEVRHLVSKLFNPVTLTVGIGLDYKPNKTTSINFSPLSYKGTFVIDPATIDQTLYGITKGKRSKNEPGASLMVSNEFKPFKNLTVTNRLQLFTNYIKNPQNIDVDWEMIAQLNLNWFTDVRFNTHLIFDDDTKTPILMGDGTEKKTARIQFKEMLGFSFVFRF